MVIFHEIILVVSNKFAVRIHFFKTALAHEWAYFPNCKFTKILLSDKSLCLGKKTD